MDAGNFAATGGVSGAVLAVGYILYKMCYKRKFHSKCCGAEMDVATEPSPTRDTQIEIPPVAAAPIKPTPKSSPTIRPLDAPAQTQMQMPRLDL